MEIYAFLKKNSKGELSLYTDSETFKPICTDNLGQAIITKNNYETIYKGKQLQIVKLDVLKGEFLEIE